MIQKNKACRRSPLSVSVSVLVAALCASLPTGRATAATSAGTSAGLSLVSSGAEEPADDNESELYLEVSLNQAPTGHLARFVLIDGQLHASAATLRELGLKWPGSENSSGLVALAQIPGLQAEYHAAYQRVALMAPLELLDHAPARLGFTQPDAPRIDPTTRAPGLILNYDLYGQQGNDIGSLSGWNELRLFGLGPGVWSNTMSSRLVSNSGQAVGSNSVSGFDNVRLDSSWQLDLPDRMLSLSIGDTITGAVSWSRATRIGGIRLSRNFSLQPYRITAPLASFAGEAALPSTVDLLINGFRQSSQQVQPGQFQIDSAPTLNGTGQAQLVITDVNGQSRVMSFPLYGSPQLLQVGLSDWSLDAGMVRRQYGLESFSYAHDPMFSASGRYGLSDRTTLETHAEFTRGLQLGGMGGVWLLGSRGGVISGSVAASRYASHGGMQGSVSYQWNSRAFNVFLGSTRRDADFRDVASLESSLLPRRTDQAFLGTSNRLGQWGVSYIGQRYADDGQTRYVSLSWSRQLPRNASLNLNLSRDLERDNGYNAFLSWTMPLDRYLSTSASARHSRNARSVTAEASRSVPSDTGGWGWRAQSTFGDDAGGQAQISQLGRYGQWTAGVDYWRGGRGIESSSTVYASANGGLLLMGSHLHAMRRVDDAFALVSTDGVAGVPVKLENRLVGVTDRDGLLLINRLNAWQRNQLSIDPMRLPADMRIDRTNMDATPASRSGMLATFPMRRILSVQLALRDATGNWLPAGSPAWLGTAPSEAEPDTYVGYDGLVYVQDPPAGARVNIRNGNTLCSVVLPPMPNSRGLVDLGELICK